MERTNNVSASNARSEPGEFCLFISSTFQDMVPEREHLVKHVLPAVRAMCRERGVQCTEIDLRWGITTEQARQGKIVAICLDELRARTPFFIGVLGSRYGWVPDAGEFEKQHDVTARYPWLLHAVKEGSSILEMEMVEGVLNSSSMRGRACFYFRDPAIVREGYVSEGLEALRRLEVLKERIRESGFPVREPFSDPETLGAWVLEDVRAALDRLYPVVAVSSQIEAERRAHEAFAATRRRAYVEHAETMDRLDCHAAGEEPPLVITGEPGAGKSALVAHWSRRYLAAHPDAFILTHYVGATASGSDHYALLRRIMAEIRERYAIAEELPLTPEDIESRFPVWLAYVQKERLVLVIDALNQLDERSQGLAWLPAHIPSRVRLVVTTQECDVLETLRDRGWQELNLEPLTPAERVSVVQNFLSDYGKTLSAEQVQRVSDDPTSANPLFLRTRLEELRVFGSHEALNERITYYLEARGLDDLFERVLARFEADYGEELVRSVMTALWAARRGLSEMELAGVVCREPAQVVRLLQALDVHLMSRAELFTFFHNHLRDSVERRYLRSDVDRTRARLQVAEYFRSRPVDERSADELPWLLMAAGARDMLAQCIAGLEMFTFLWAEPRRFDLTRYWVELASHYDAEELYAASLAAHRPVAGTSDARAQLLGDLGNFFQLIARHRAAGHYLKRALEWMEREGKADTPAYATLLGDYAAVLVAVGDYTAGAAMLERSATVLQHSSELESRQYIRVCEQRAHLAYVAKEYGTAERLYEEIQVLVRGGEEDDLDRIVIEKGLGAICYAKREYAQARNHFDAALTTVQARLGREHPDVANTLNNLGTAYAGQGYMAEAIGCLREALAINEKMLGPHHPEVASNLMNLGYMLKQGGEVAEAETMYRRAVAVRQKIHGERHPERARDLVNLAALLKEQGRFEEALVISREALQIREEVLGAGHLDTLITQLHLASILKDVGQYEKAVSLYEAYLPLEVELAGIDAPHVRLVINSYGELLRWMDREDDARILEEGIAEGVVVLNAVRTE